MRAVAVVILSVALACSAAARAAGDSGDELKARTAFAAGEYKEALEIYARLYAETMHPTYLRNIARCHQNLGNADKAISSFREYLRKSPELSPAQRKEIEGYIAEMEQLKQSQARQPAAAPATSPTPTSPPPAVAPAETSPALVGPPTVTASGTRDEEAPFYTRVWFWGVVAGVVAAGVVTAFLLTRGGTDRTAGNLGPLDLTGKTP